jgi:hypothetical protein
VTTVRWLALDPVREVQHRTRTEYMELGSDVLKTAAHRFPAIRYPHAAEVYADREPTLDDEVAIFELLRRLDP